MMIVWKSKPLALARTRLNRNSLLPAPQATCQARDNNDMHNFCSKKCKASQTFSGHAALQLKSMRIKVTDNIKTVRILQ